MKSKLVALGCPFFVLGFTFCGTSSKSTSTPPTTATAPTTTVPKTAVYMGAAKTAIDKHCAGCHTTASPEGGVILDTYVGVSGNRAGSYDAINSGRMPKSNTISPAADKTTLVNFFGATTVTEN